eukprot:9553177-Karenia_brevis.AAC.1
MSNSVQVATSLREAAAATVRLTHWAHRPRNCFGTCLSVGMYVLQMLSSVGSCCCALVVVVGRGAGDCVAVTVGRASAALAAGRHRGQMPL